MEQYNLLKILGNFYWQDWCCTGNNDNVFLWNKKGSIVSGVSNSISEHNIYQEVNQSGSFSNYGHKFVRGCPIFEEPHKIPSNLYEEILIRKALENIRPKNINTLRLAQLNINDMRNIFDFLKHI